METPRKPAPPSDDIDLMRYVSLFISNWLWIAAALFLALGIAYVFNRYSQRSYNVKSTLLIKEKQTTGAIANMEQIFTGNIYNPYPNLDDEVAILQSYTLNQRVIEEMPETHVAYIPVAKNGIQGQRTYKSSPFVLRTQTDIQPEGVQMTIRFTEEGRYTVEINEEQSEAWEKNNPETILKGEINQEKEYIPGELFEQGRFSFTVEPRDSTRDIVDETKRWLVWFESVPALANNYRSGLKVEPVKEYASVFTLSFDGYSPEQGTDYLNTLMELYIKQGMEWKSRAADNTINFIEAQLGLISDSLRLAENTMESFRLNNRFVDLTLEGTLVLEKLEKLEGEKNMLGLQEQYYEYLLEYLQARDEDNSIISPSVMGVTDPVLVKLVEDFSKIQQERKKIAFTVQDDLPQVQLMDQKLEDARRALRENVSSAISQLRLTMNTINGRIASAERDLGRLPGTERRLIGIQRKFDLNNSVYTYLLERRAEAGIAKASQITDNRIIDQAIVTNSVQTRPKSMKNYLVAILLGLMVPMVLIIIFDLLNNKIIGRHDIEHLTKAPIIGYISHSDYHVEDPVAEKPGSTLAESFRAVRTSLSFYTGQTKCPVIVISSPVSGEGKTFVSVNLATIISMMNKKVLIVGLDMRKPRVHAILKAVNGHGMSQYLSGTSAFEEVIVPTQIENLWFAPSGPVPPNPAELIGSPKMAEFIARARNDFDTVIIDTPPVGIVTDALLLSQLANVTLFVVRQRYTTRGSVQLLDEIYRKGEMANVAILVNDISAAGYYGYGLRYGYSLGYGNRYYDPGNYYTKSSKSSGYYTND
ncbi:MAG: polysaccharide biosynthesis tyrosine autokinase [Bacteroidales bacterium]|jgi:capsular exopolysaccharide synthesis family protein|nr:polysaccharide biosynthesis tyrosine autokinase [Bacteroidales bacterium]